jgi:hypothetical protein
MPQYWTLCCYPRRFYWCFLNHWPVSQAEYVSLHCPSAVCDIFAVLFSYLLELNHCSHISILKSREIWGSPSHFVAD